MQRLIALLVLFCSVPAAVAGELCDAECLVTIEFTDAGYIEAHEALTFTFGDGGLVDTIAAVIAKADGETLMLNAGERLDFGAGGRLELGNGGNLEFIHVEFNNASTLSLEAIGAPREISIDAGSTLELTGNTAMLLHSALVNRGTMVFTGTTALNTGGTGCAAGCQIAAGTFTLAGSPTGLVVFNPGAGNLAANISTWSANTAAFNNITISSEDDELETDNTTAEDDSDSDSGALSMDAWLLLVALVLLRFRRHVDCS